MLLTAAALTIVNARLWDGTGAPAHGPVDIQVEAGRIVAVGEHLPERSGAQVLDASGATVIPGLIDSHVHLSLDPGAGWRHDTPAEHETLVRAHMRALLACGVTTVVDPAVLPAEEALVRSIEPGPRYLSLGTPFSPAGGYVSIVIPSFPGVGTLDGVERQLDAAVGQIGIKVTVERGFYGPVWPLHSEVILTAIRDGAVARTPQQWMTEN